MRVFQQHKDQKISSETRKQHFHQLKTSNDPIFEDFLKRVKKRKKRPFNFAKRLFKAENSSENCRCYPSTK